MTVCYFMFGVFFADFLMSCFFSSRRRHTRCALVTGVQTCAPDLLGRCDPGDHVRRPIGAAVVAGDGLVEQDEVGVVVDELTDGDRESVGEGKSVSERVDRGGGGIIKKKKQERKRQRYEKTDKTSDTPQRDIETKKQNKQKE